SLIYGFRSMNSMAQFFVRLGNFYDYLEDRPTLARGCVREFSYGLELVSVRLAVHVDFAHPILSGPGPTCRRSERGAPRRAPCTASSAGISGACCASLSLFLQQLLEL